MYTPICCQGCGGHGALVLYCQHILPRLQNALINQQPQCDAASSRLACARTQLDSHRDMIIGLHSLPSKDLWHASV